MRTSRGRALAILAGALVFSAPLGSGFGTDAAMKARKEFTALSPEGLRIITAGGGWFDECWECLSCAFFTKHQNPTNGTADDGYLAPHGECISPSYCEGGHPTCSGFVVDIPRVVEQVLASNGDELRRLLQDQSDHLLLNVERQAVQVLGCHGALEAHIPLTAEQLSSLHPRTPMLRGL